MALSLGFTDFEDAVLHEAARQIDAAAIVTRNAGDFKKAALPVYTPEELARILDLQRIGEHEAEELAAELLRAQRPPTSS